ncbi:hypothetical protein ACWED2_38390 [Amycolatopsis sp. NPDC005003]
MHKQFNLILDVDTLSDGTAQNQEKVLVDRPDLRIEVLDQETGHGFGLAEIVTVTVLIGTNVTSDLAASYIRDGIKAVIRRVKGPNRETDGNQESISKLIEAERKIDDEEGDR